MRLIELDRMENWRKTFWACFLALAVILSALVPHGAIADSQMNHIDEPASFHLTSTAACNPSGSATEAGSACMVMPGHCLTVSCAPYLMATPLAVKIDIDHPTYRAHLSGILSIVDTPPPRA